MYMADVKPRHIAARTLSVIRETVLPCVLPCVLAAILSCAGVCYAQETNVAGYWSGTTRVMPCTFSPQGRCNAVNNITFTFTQRGGRIRGKFTCAYGNLNCRNGGSDDTGKIVSGRISGKEIRLSVLIPADVSNCYYVGRLTSDAAIHGTYSCYQGGGLREEGIWDVTRARPGS
jgi:hypothetical protein